MASITHWRGLLAALLACAFGLAPAASASASTLVTLKKTETLQLAWEYRWGDEAAWKPLRELGRLPNRQGRQLVYMRARLPEDAAPDPAMLVGEIHQSYEIYLDGVRIGGLGDIAGRTAFRGYGSNLIRLPADYGGRTILFAIRSDYPLIGLYGDVRLDSRSRLLEDMLRDDAMRLLFALLYAFVGLLFAFLYFKDRSQPEYMYFALFLVGMAVWGAARTDVRFVLWDSPVFWTKCRVYTIFVVPVFFILFYERLLGRGFRGLSTRIWQLHAAYAAVMILLVELGIVPVMEALVPFDCLLLFSIGFTVVYGCYRALQGSAEGRVFTIGSSVFALASAFDILATMGLAPWSRPISHWGLLLFVACMAVIMGRHFLRYGILGAQLNFRDEQMDHTMRVTTWGISFLNHMIKNETAKINFMAGKLQTSVERSGREEEARAIGHIVQTTRYLREMVDRIRERTADIVPTKEHCDVDELMKWTTLAIRPLLEKHRMTVDAWWQDGGFEGDPYYLRETFMNVCTNAVEAMEPGRGALRIRAELDKRRVRFEFADNGCGIPEANAKRIYEPFFSTKNARSNYGLGLSFCYNVVRRHGGTMAIESRPGGGTLVRIELPRR